MISQSIKFEIDHIVTSSDLSNQYYKYMSMIMSDNDQLT